jgi:drug/metabolite transporter (DMT)-like permease
MTALLYIILCLIWGSTWLAIRIGLEGAPPFWAASFRFILAVCILAVIVKFKKLKYPTNLRDMLKLSLPGLFMYGISYASVYWGEVYINSATAAVLFGSYPFFVALLSHLNLEHEQVKTITWLGLLVGFLGVVLISYDNLQTSTHLFFGSVLTIIGSFTSAYGLVLHKKFHSQHNIFVAATVQMFAGCVFLIVIAYLFENITDFVVSKSSIGAIFYLAILGTVIAFLGYYWLLKHTRAVTVSLIGFVTPLIAIVVGQVVAHETLSALIYIGSAMILSGIVLVVRK